MRHQDARIGLDGQTFTLSLTGGPVEVRRLGPACADQPSLVLLHEGLGCISIWRDFPERLAALTGLSLLVASRHGYGGSGPISLPRPLDYLHREATGPLPELLGKLEVGRHLLVGHSDGATIALLNAALAPAAGLAGLVAMAPHVFVEEMTVAGIQAAVEAYAQDSGPQSLRSRLARHHGGNVDLAFRGWSDTWLHPGFRDWNVEAEMAGIRVPSLLIQGRGDEYASLEQLDRIERRVASPCRQLVIENCGHSPQLDHPETVAAAIAAFAREIFS